MTQKIRLAYLLIAPITYQAAMLQELACQAEIDLTVLYRTDASLGKFYEPGLNKEISWDIPLLDGYRSAFLPVLGNKHKINFWQPFNYGLFKALRKGKFDVLWIHGYTNWHEMLAIFYAKLLGIKVLLRGESQAMATNSTAYPRMIKRVFFKILDSVSNGFLAIGKLNRQFYLQNGISDKKIFLAPYTVHNRYFQEKINATDTNILRQKLQLQSGRSIILYASKLFGRKRPQDLLTAYFVLCKTIADDQKPYLIFVGTGELETILQQQAKQGGDENIRFCGFQNQSALPSYYALADLFVLPSEREPWGLVVNEAMNAGAIIIASDQVGSAHDLIQQGINGYRYPAGDIAQLTQALRDGIALLGSEKNAKQASIDIINQWSYTQTALGVVEGCKYVMRD